MPDTCRSFGRNTSAQRGLTRLVAEERADFDQAYRRALAEAAETLELAGVLDTLGHWRRRAIMSVLLVQWIG